MPSVNSQRRTPLMPCVARGGTSQSIRARNPSIGRDQCGRAAALCFVWNVGLAFGDPGQQAWAGEIRRPSFGKLIEDASSDQIHERIMGVKPRRPTGAARRMGARRSGASRTGRVEQPWLRHHRCRESRARGLPVIWREPLAVRPSRPKAVNVAVLLTAHQNLATPFGPPEQG